jgi:hypothetical protein
MHIDAIDRDALAHLENLTLDHDPADARNVTFHFVSQLSFLVLSTLLAKKKASDFSTCILIILFFFSAAFCQGKPLLLRPYLV